MIKLPNIKGLVSVAKGFTMAHRPELLLGASVASTLGAVVTAAVGGYKSALQVERARMEKVASPEGPFDTFIEYYDTYMAKADDLTVKEKIQLTWLNYLPSAGLTAGALGATTGLHLVHVSEKKALAQAAAFAIGELRSELSEYEEQVNEAVTGKKAEQIKNKMMEARADENGSVNVINSDGAVEELYLVRDAKTGRDIWSNENRIQEAANNVNKWLAKHGDCDLNTFYSHAGFSHTPDGEDWGWSGDFVELKWDLVMRDDGRPVRRFAFLVDPKAGVVS